MIELRNIHKTYQKRSKSIQALKGIDLKVEQGDIFGVIGYSGAGKSTLVRLVNYLEQPTEGKIIVDGRSLTEQSSKALREIKKDIGMIFQHFNLLESKTIYQNVAMPLIISKVPKQDIKRRVTELLEFVGLSDKVMSYPNELSGGQKQRVGIARALALNPKILLCDEATSALDPQTTQSILNLLKRINREYGITILLITHEMSVIQSICNRVAVMENGKIIEEGTVLDVFGDPKHPTTQDFVQTVVRTDIPRNIKANLDKSGITTLTKLEMVGDHATQPLLALLIQKFNLTVSTVFTNMTEIQETTLAIWYVDIQGEAKDKAAALDFLDSQGVRYQEVSV
ncbi:ATP-binding cassette domain-containing protein [Amphibacillus sp. MSJ-3]|uniref:methionine ABC transporter ATP-binding protein n=1 Tax=Amphibacillus sp. MSJ-3 TaxID=2841505 RepID=UPI001C0EEF0C|nr:ATP-binding cassette domain-containing protein [Amphibacillus sp. MSJ-3]MBU5594063.1 ATP-binding cassette domain-containing protein [Amphibacillus sp. MSJ-3]